MVGLNPGPSKLELQSSRFIHYAMTPFCMVNFFLDQNWLFQAFYEQIESSQELAQLQDVQLNKNKS